jgi:hypothetical protein
MRLKGRPGPRRFEEVLEDMSANPDAWWKEGFFY